MVTDYDCWKEGEEIVDAQLVMKVIAANVDNVRKLIVETIKQMSLIDWSDIIKQNKVCVFPYLYKQ